MMSGNDNRVDVIIVGAGPAGLGVALHLLRLDPSWSDRMLILEKEAHPRHKLCGGGITPFGLSQLSSLDLGLDIQHVPIQRAWLEFQDLRLEVRGNPVIAVTHRQDFDAWLADQTRRRGVQILENHPVHDIETTPNGFIVHTPQRTLTTRVLVGADGVKGIVRKWVGARERPPHISRLLETVTLTHSQSLEHEKKLARFDFNVLLEGVQGYYWDFPSTIEGQPHLNSGVYDSRVYASKNKADLKQSFAKRRQQHQRQPLGNFEGHPIRWFTPTNLLSRPGVILVGDSAGVDPLFGEGIGVALGYAEVAARAIQKAFKRMDFRFSTFRWGLLWSRVGRYLFFRWLGANVLYRNHDRPILLQLFWRAAILISTIVGPWRVRKVQNSQNATEINGSIHPPH